MATGESETETEQIPDRRITLHQAYDKQLSVPNPIRHEHFELVEAAERALTVWTRIEPAVTNRDLRVVAEHARDRVDVSIRRHNQNKAPAFSDETTLPSWSSLCAHKDERSGQTSRSSACWLNARASTRSFPGPSLRYKFLLPVRNILTDQNVHLQLSTPAVAVSPTDRPDNFFVWREHARSTHDMLAQDQELERLCAELRHAKTPEANRFIREASRLSRERLPDGSLPPHEQASLGQLRQSMKSLINGS